MRVNPKVKNRFGPIMMINARFRMEIKIKVPRSIVGKDWIKSVRLVLGSGGGVDGGGASTGTLGVLFGKGCLKSS